MISSRDMAIFAAAVLALFLWLRPVIGGLGAPAPKIEPPKRVTTAVAPAIPARGATPAAPVRHLDAVARAILVLTNAERSKKGLPSLAEEPGLARIATAHCDDMIARRFFEHIDPDGLGPSDRVARGHRTLVGTSAENIWSGTGVTTDNEQTLAEMIVAGWMGSQGHRENILRSGLTHLGVGVSQADKELRATQLFAHSWGFLEAELPVELPVGSSPFLGFRAYGSVPDPEQMDLFADGFPNWGPKPIGGLRLDVEPGRYLTRFYFLKPDPNPKPGLKEYTIAFGPEVEIKP